MNYSIFPWHKYPHNDTRNESEQTQIINRRALIFSAVALIGTCLLGCGGSSGTLAEADPVPLAGYYEGAYTRSAGSAGGSTKSGVAQIRILGLEDRQPRTDQYPAVEPGDVQGVLGPNAQGSDSQLAGRVTGSDHIEFSFVEGIAEGTLIYNPDTRVLTGTFPVKAFGTNADVGAISFNVIKQNKLASGKGLTSERSGTDGDGQGS